MIEQVNGTTFRAPIGDDWVEIGNIDASKFEPHIMLPWWNGERKVKVMPHGVMAGEVELEVEADKIKSKYKLEIGGVEQEIETEFYVRPPTEQFESGIAELDIILPRRPNDNRIILDIEAEGVDFFHQPPLTPEEIAEGVVRPDNIVNSYAVYDKVKRDHAIGETNYMCGKLFHLPRPRPVDALGNWCWADLLIENGKQIVTIPWDFLNNAVYPIRHVAGDTFGKTAIGGTSGSMTADRMRWPGITHTPGAGTGTSMSVYCEDSGEDVKMSLYKNSDLTFVMGTVEVEPADAPAWKTGNFTSNPALLAIAYQLVFWQGHQTWFWWDDTGVDYQYRVEAYGGAWPDPVGWTTSTSHRYFSLYCTYTAEEPPVAVLDKSYGAII